MVGRKYSNDHSTQISFWPDSYLDWVEVNKDIFKLFQKEKARRHTLSSWNGIYIGKTIDS